MARTLNKNLTAAIRAGFMKGVGGLSDLVRNSVNGGKIQDQWSYDNGFEQRWRNAAGTDDIRAVSVDANNKVLVADGAIEQQTKPITFHIRTGADMVSQTVFIVPGPCRIVKIQENHETAESTASTLTCYVEKLTGTQAPGAGTSVMTGTFNLKATACTVQTATLINTTTGDSDAPELQLAAGERLAVVFSGAADDLADVTITISLAPAGEAIWVPINISPNDNQADQHIFVADRDYIVTGAYYVHRVKSSAAGKIMLTKCTGAAQAPASGTALLTNNTNTGWDQAATADTVQTGTLTATATALRLAPGNTLALNYPATVTDLVGVCIVVVLQARERLVPVIYNLVPAADTTACEGSFFVADRNYEIVSIHAIWTTAGAALGVFQITRATFTTAGASGTDLVTSTGFDATGTANTSVAATFADARFNHLMAGDRLGIDPAMSDMVGLCVTVMLRPE